MGRNVCLASEHFGRDEDRCYVKSILMMAFLLLFSANTILAQEPQATGNKASDQCEALVERLLALPPGPGSSGQVEEICYSLRSLNDQTSPSMARLADAYQRETEYMSKVRIKRALSRVGGPWSQKALDRINGVSSTDRSDAKANASISKEIPLPNGGDLVPSVTISFDAEGRMLTRWKTIFPEGTYAVLAIKRLKSMPKDPKDWLANTDLLLWGSNVNGKLERDGIFTQTEPIEVEGMPYCPGVYELKFRLYIDLARQTPEMLKRLAEADGRLPPVVKELESTVVEVIALVTLPLNSDE